jgi:hypothetical protein
MIIGVITSQNLLRVPFRNIRHFRAEYLWWEVWEYLILSPLHAEQLIGPAPFPVTRALKAFVEDVVDSSNFLSKPRPVSIVKKLGDVVIGDVEITGHLIAFGVDEQVGRDIVANG